MRIESTCHCSFVFLMKDMKRTLRFQAYQNIRNLMNPLAFALQKRLVHLTKILSSAKSRIQVLGYLVNCAGNRYPSTGSFLIKNPVRPHFLPSKFWNSTKPKPRERPSFEWNEGSHAAVVSCESVGRQLERCTRHPTKNMADPTFEVWLVYGQIVGCLVYWCCSHMVQTCSFGNPFNRFGQKPKRHSVFFFEQRRNDGNPKKLCLTPSRPPFAAMVPLQTTADPTAQRETNKSQSETWDKIKFLPLATSSIVFQKGSSMTMTFLGVHRNAEQM